MADVDPTICGICNGQNSVGDLICGQCGTVLPLISRMTCAQEQQLVQMLSNPPPKGSPMDEALRKAVEGVTHHEPIRYSADLQTTAPGELAPVVHPDPLTEGR